MTTQTDFYYSAQGQIIQEDSIDPTSGTATLSAQNVWGEAYVNELVLRDFVAAEDGSGNYGISGSGLNDRDYALQDANFDITSLVNANGTVQERFLFQRDENGWRVIEVKSNLEGTSKFDDLIDELGDGSEASRREDFRRRTDADLPGIPERKANI
jgi:hypothetical protein